MPRITNTRTAFDSFNEAVITLEIFETKSTPLRKYMFYRMYSFRTNFRLRYEILGSQDNGY